MQLEGSLFVRVTVAPSCEATGWMAGILSTRARCMPPGWAGPAPRRSSCPPRPDVAEGRFRYTDEQQWCTSSANLPGRVTGAKCANFVYRVAERLAFCSWRNPRADSADATVIVIADALAPLHEAAASADAHRGESWVRAIAPRKRRELAQNHACFATARQPGWRGGAAGRLVLNTFASVAPARVKRWREFSLRSGERGYSLPSPWTTCCRVQVPGMAPFGFAFGSVVWKLAFPELSIQVAL